MFQLMQWAARWGVPLEAIRDLERQIGTYSTEPGLLSGRSEAAVQSLARLKAAEVGGALWRNNIGAYEDRNGQWVRYGLANDSKAMNGVVKSSDLIGIYPLKIEIQHVGLTVGQFWAIETKSGDWHYTATAHEKAQLAFGQLVVKKGGRFSFEKGEFLWT